MNNEKLIPLKNYIVEKIKSGFNSDEIENVLKFRDSLTKKIFNHVNKKPLPETSQNDFNTFYFSSDLKKLSYEAFEGCIKCEAKISKANKKELIILNVDKEFIYGIKISEEPANLLIHPTTIEVGGKKFINDVGIRTTGLKEEKRRIYNKFLGALPNVIDKKYPELNNGKTLEISTPFNKVNNIYSFLKEVEIEVVKKYGRIYIAEKSLNLLQGIINNHSFTRIGNTFENLKDANLNHEGFISQQELKTLKINNKTALSMIYQDLRRCVRTNEESGISERGKPLLIELPEISDTRNYVGRNIDLGKLKVEVIVNNNGALHISQKSLLEISSLIDEKKGKKKQQETPNNSVIHEEVTGNLTKPGSTPD
jgi:hypothetical protein